MGKMIIAFLFIFGFFALGMNLFSTMTKSEKLGLTKVVGYSILCSVITVVVIAAIVLIF